MPTKLMKLTASMQHFKQKDFPNHKKSGREAVNKGEKSVNHNENKGEGIFLKMGLYNIPSIINNIELLSRAFQGLHSILMKITNWSLQKL